MNTEAPIIMTLDDAAAGTHEIFTAYLRAGFKRDEAMKLVLQQLRISHECPNHTDKE